MEKYQLLQSVLVKDWENFQNEFLFKRIIKGLENRNYRVLHGVLLAAEIKSEWSISTETRDRCEDILEIEKHGASNLYLAAKELVKDE